MAKQKLGGKLIFNNPILGGLSTNKYIGKANSFHKIVGLDIFSEPGIITPAQALKEETTVNEKAIILCSSNGAQYFFSQSSGKIWMREYSTGTYTLVHTTVPTSGDASCFGVCEYNGYIYWATATYLHKIASGNATASTWSTGMTQNWQAITSSVHPMVEVNSVLYIATGNTVAQVDNVTFTASKLTLPYGYSTTCLCKFGTDLVIGAQYTNSNKFAQVFVWNTYSKSFSYSDEIQTSGLEAMVEYYDTVLIFAAKTGEIYYLNGTKTSIWYRLPYVQRYRSTPPIYPNLTVSTFAVTAWRNLIYVGVTDYIFDNDPMSGVYVLGSFDNTFPQKTVALQHPLAVYDANGYPKLNQVINDVKMVDGLNKLTLFVTFYDRETSTYKVNVTDYSNRYTKSYIDTRLVFPDNYNLSRFRYGWADYETLPANTAVDLKVSSNHGAYGSAVTKTDDTMRSRVEFDLASLEAKVAQFRLDFTASGLYGPKVHQFGIKID